MLADGFFYQLHVHAEKRFFSSFAAAHKYVLLCSFLSKPTDTNEIRMN